MKKNAQIARAAVVETLPVAAPPRCLTCPSVISSNNDASGMAPSRLQNRMKKNIVHRNGTKRSVCSFRAGRKTSTRRNSRIDFEEVLRPGRRIALRPAEQPREDQQHQQRRHQRHDMWLVMPTGPTLK